MEKIISAEHLTKQIADRTVVSDASFDVFSSEVFGFIGPEGSGKTTLIRMLTGNSIPTDGDATVFGQSVLKLSRRVRQKIGYMPEFTPLYPELTVWENMNFQASLYGVSPFRKKRILKLLTSLDLADQRKVLVSDLTHDLQRRASFAAALVHQPELIFLDDPAGGLDSSLQNWYWDHINELRSSGATFVVATRSAAAAQHCDTVALIAEGRILMIGAPAELQRTVFGGELIDLTASGLTGEMLSELARLSFVRQNPRYLDNGSIRVVVEEASTAMPALTGWCADQNITVQSVHQYIPPFDDSFYEHVAAIYG